MLLAVLSGIAFSILLLFAGRFFKSNYSFLASLLPLSLFGYFLSKLPLISGVNQGSTQNLLLETYKWIPSLGVNLTFKLDGLSLLFSLLITGIGSLVFIYTSYYLKGHKFLDRFYGYLSLFMAAMLGLVLSDNLISMFVFWELTSISSFFLIGFNNNDASSRKSALLALGITGFGGLSLLGAAILLGSTAGTYNISEILNSGFSFEEGGLYLATIILFFVAAFTKSAQFPLHFWLPGAMKAPTPVSTYLHSATMVKAGIYLLLRLTPVLGDHAWWNTPLLIVGAVTMLYAAVQTLFKTDLKGILAYSTISALGILVFLIGVGTQAALLAAGVFILVHALYKATLFLITGIIDHETHTRDISKLSGLRKVLFPVFIAGMLAAISNAGIPPSFGFLGKDLIYEALLHANGSTEILIFLAVSTNILLLFAGFLVGFKPFLGPLPTQYEKIKLPSARLWVPALLLGVLSLIFGVFPGLVEQSLIKPFMFSVSVEPSAFHLKLWHGFNLVLLLSSVTILVGALLYLFYKPTQIIEERITKLEIISPKTIVTTLAEGLENFSRVITNILQNGYLRHYVYTIISFTLVLVGYKFVSDTRFYINFSKLSEVTFYEASIVGIMFISILFTVFTQSRLRAVAAMGVMGYALCLLFVFYSAPDLAMTQFAIDTLTVILFVLVLYKLPSYLKFSKPISRFKDAVLSIAFGLLITLITLEVLNEPINRETGNFYAENSYLLAKGKNVVNVILVDFRGADTLVEIAVLTIAALGVFSLLKLRLKKSER
jgi:multicomponent Na+:H+ antiporter subunit A